MTPLLRHRRSRLQPAFGQINPSKRPFGALGLTEPTSRRTWQLSSRLRNRPVNSAVTRSLSRPPTDFLLPRPRSVCTPPSRDSLAGSLRCRHLVLATLATATTPATRRRRAEPHCLSRSLVKFDDEDQGRSGSLIWSRPDDATVSTPRQALSGWSGCGHSSEADERREAHGDSADDGEDRLPSR